MSSRRQNRKTWALDWLGVGLALGGSSSGTPNNIGFGLMVRALLENGNKKPGNSKYTSNTSLQSRADNFSNN